MKKIALIADAESLWTKRYVENVLLGGEYAVDIFSATNGRFADFYREKEVQVYSQQESTWLARQRIVGLVKTAHDLTKKSHEEYHIIQVHFVSELQALAFYFLRKKNRRARAIWTYWGSDLLRAPGLYLQWKKLVIGKVDAVSFVTKNLAERFHEIYSWKKEEMIVDFGNAVFDRILRLQKREGIKEECKEQFGFPAGKYSVMVGYNARVEQQHKRIIAALADVRQEVKEKMHIVYHFSYGDASAEYRRELAELTEREGFSYTVVDDFLEDEEMARFRTATDIFVHGQTTDALSGSMQESLFAGSIVINGGWLKYPEFEEMGIRDIKFQNFSDLGGILEDVVENFAARQAEAASNKEALYRANSWEILKPKWLRLLEGGCD